MSNKIPVISFLFLCLLLSACSLNENAVDLYEQQDPLIPDITLPATFSDNTEEEIKVTLTQNGSIIKEVDTVEIEIWKQDGTYHSGVKKAQLGSLGQYSVKAPFDKDGLYVVQIKASVEDKMIMPEQQIIVGELSKSDREYLQQQAPKPMQSHEGHH
ncbi:FixH family protein [Pontibacillus salicampi]|uniref:FixH family protein n=1 Tax=Pontibacillus salicampi TaxID=1449801 RepID=A0ABV6LSR7_9BACI